MRRLIFLIVILISTLGAAQNDYYHTVLLRAKPGSLLELIDLLKEKASNNSAADGKTYILRHSQGDHWDLMVIYAIPSAQQYFSHYLREMRGVSHTIVNRYGSDWYDMIAFQEEAIVAGPMRQEMEALFDSSNLFHIEIFTALYGKQKELVEERKMENDYLENINRKPNLIFTRVFGPSWDSFTIGGYKDMHDFAGPEITIEEEDKAAKDAGFESVYTIGSYLRSLISEHNDTLAKKVSIE